MKHELDLNFYKGWTRKAVTFSIDDGNIRFDKKFLDFVKPAGIKGTFNLCSHSTDQLPDAESYRKFYSGYEIANHVKFHPYCIPDGETPLISDNPFDPQNFDPKYLYKTDVPHLYMKNFPRGWRMIADAEGYINLTAECRNDLEEIFGKGSVRSFVWPYGAQKNTKLFEYLIGAGYYGIRNAGHPTLGKDGFDVPEDRNSWMYTAAVNELRDCTDLYLNYKDDGKLKFFCFGVHSVDYENAGKWDDIEYLCDKFGNKPEEYYSATVGEIFDYCDALKKVEVTDEKIINPTNTDLYIKIDGKRRVLCANSEISF